MKFKIKYADQIVGILSIVAIVAFFAIVVSSLCNVFLNFQYLVLFVDLLHHHSPILHPFSFVADMVQLHALPFKQSRGRILRIENDGGAGSVVVDFGWSEIDEDLG